MSSSPVRNFRPHIRLNSGQHNPFLDLGDSSPPIPPRHGSQRVLTPSPSPRAPTSPEPSDYLIPPKPSSNNSRANVISATPSIMSSRPTSMDSFDQSDNCKPDRPDGGTGGYHLVSPTSDSRPVSRDDSEHEITTQTVATKYNIMPMDGLLLFPEDTEKDDYMHNPDPNEKVHECDICNRRGMVNMGGLVVLTVGFLMLFVGYPVLYVFSGLVF